eukprot:g1612.t1
MGNEVSIDKAKWLNGDVMVPQMKKVHAKLVGDSVEVMQIAFVMKQSDTIGSLNARMIVQTRNSFLLYKPIMGNNSTVVFGECYGKFFKSSIISVDIFKDGNDLKICARGTKARKTGLHSLTFTLEGNPRDVQSAGMATRITKQQWASRLQAWWRDQSVPSPRGSTPSTESSRSAATSSSRSRRVVVRCPANVGPGQPVKVRVGDRTLTVRVPAGVTSGGMFAVMVPVDDDDDDEEEATGGANSTASKTPSNETVRVINQKKKKEFAQRKAGMLQRSNSRFRFKFDANGTMRFFRDSGVREDVRNPRTPVKSSDASVDFRKLTTNLKEEQKAWHDFLRMMGADVGASRSDLRSVFDESRKAAGLSYQAEEALHKFLDAHPGMGDATTQAWVRRFSKTGRLQLSPALTGPIGAPENRTGMSYDQLSKIATMPFKKKSEWFLSRMKAMMIPFENGHVDVVIRRDMLLEDSAKKINLLTSHQLHQIWRIYFKNAQYATAVSVVDNDDGDDGDESDVVSSKVNASASAIKEDAPVAYVFEKGIDAGGLTRAWFESITHLFFDIDYGLFKFSAADNLTYQINPLSKIVQPNHLLYFHCLGRIMGRALLTGQVMPAPMTRPIYKHLLGYPVTFNDLQYVDPDLHANLSKMLKMDEDQIESTYLDFTVTLGSMLGRKDQTIELRPGGADEDVTIDNIDDYVALLAKFYCYSSIKDQIEAMLRGFYAVVPESFLCVFDPQELELMLCGMPVIDVEDWRRNTDYKDGYSYRSKQVRWFWEIIAGFDEDEKARLLQFCTGTSRVPIGGFKSLQSNNGKIRKFCIQKVKNVEKLPVAHTCFNRIELPTYKSKQRLVDVLQVILALDLDSMGFNIE